MKRGLGPMPALLAVPLLCVAFQSAGPSDREITASVHAALGYLRAQGSTLGRYPALQPFPKGEECLVYYAMQMAGVSPRDPLLQGLESTVLSVVEEVDHTYTLALALLGLTATRDTRHSETVGRLITRLSLGQFKHGKQGKGAWGYVVPPYPGMPSRSEHDPAHWDTPQDWYDSSNTQYAVLALRSAADFGFQMDHQVFERAVKHLLSTQQNSGGFAYAPKYRREPYTAMTAGVMGSLLMCRDHLRDNVTGRGLRRRIDSAKDRAMKWLDRSLEFPDPGTPWPYYSVYSVERLGHYAQSEVFGKRRWYEEGATWLLSQQREDGSWAYRLSSRIGITSPRVDTAFALLFLTRSSRTHTRTSEELFHLVSSVEDRVPPWRREEIRRRILAEGMAALEQLVKVLFVDELPPRMLATECLRELTGEDMGGREATTESEWKACRDRWVKYSMTRKERP